jgi:ABC-type transport system substrate-binding protein
MYHRCLPAALLAALLMGCTPAPSPTSEVSPSASPAAAERIVVGVVQPPSAPPPFLAISNTTAGGFRPASSRPELATQLVYNGLYRYDDSLAAVPDLAAEPCDVSADGLTITCHLVETTFHDGTPLTADDVAYTYELGRRHPDCLWAFLECYGEVLQSATVLDERTVEFRLTQPDASFLTLILPSVMIDSRAVIEAAYAPLVKKAPGLDAAEYQAASDAIFDRLGSDAPDCESPLPQAEALLQAAAIEPIPRDLFHRADGTFDVCMYAEWNAVFLSNIARSLGAQGLDAVALAYQTLSFNRAPIGTGPWRFVRVEDGNRAIFEANEAYHLGRPATSRIEVRAMRDRQAAVDAMRNGELDWLTLPQIYPEMYEQLRTEADVRFVTFPTSGYYLLAYNLRDGMLFADRNLRAAVELCIDKPATVGAATDGRGDAIYSPIEPASWAYQTDLVRPERDVDEARRLIESSGWTEGNDGIYQQGGERLAANVFVSSVEAARVEFMDLVAAQVRDCGVELNVVPADQDTVLRPLTEYPHIPGGHQEPFEAVFIGFGRGFDPHDETWSSRNISSAEDPLGANFMGFADPRIDALLERGIATYDQRERARIYRDFQQVLAEDHAALFGWAFRVNEAIDRDLGLTEGELNLRSRSWFWQLEKLVLREEP